MAEWELTDEEIKDAGKWHSKTIKNGKIVYADGILSADDRDDPIAKAQLKKVVGGITALLGFTARVEGNTIIIDKYDWDNFWASMVAVESLIKEEK